ERVHDHHARGVAGAIVRHGHCVRQIGAGRWAGRRRDSVVHRQVRRHHAQDHVIAGAANVADLEALPAQHDGGPFRQSRERPDDSVAPVVVDDREACTVWRRETQGAAQGGAAQVHAPGHVELVVAGAGRRPVELDDKTGAAAAPIHIAARKNPYSHPGGNRPARARRGDGSHRARAALPNVIAPDHVFVLATWRSAPPPAMPVPFSVTGSATTSPLPSSCSAAPPATVVAPAVAPRAVLFCTSSTPALTVVAPLYVLAPDNVSVPVPVLVSATVPLPF